MMKNARAYRIAIVILTLLVLAEGVWIGREVYMGQGGGTDEVTSADESALAQAFDGALAKGQLEVWYQPITDIATGETIGAEALSRWRDGETLIAPSRFIPVLEETGQITELDRHVFQTVCAFQRERAEAGETLFPISVNLSVASAGRETVAADYAAMLNDAQAPVGCVNIEITETLEADWDVLVGVVDAFHDAGFSVEIDDFGAGYAALANIAIIPYDILKLDKSLTDEIGTERGERLIRDVIELAHALDMTTIAEGVETAEQAAFLLAAGCDSAQGYYYAKPLPKQEFLDYLKP